MIVLLERRLEKDPMDRFIKQPGTIKQLQLKFFSHKLASRQPRIMGNRYHENDGPSKYS